VDNFESTIDENLVSWVGYIERSALSGTHTTHEFDIARSIQWLLFDMICRLCLGKPLGFVDGHCDRFSFQKTLEERLPIVEKFAVMTEVNVWIRLVARIPLLKRVLPTSRDTDGIGAIMGVGAETIVLPRSLLTIACSSQSEP
jgi:hypothetical protein